MYFRVSGYSHIYRAHPRATWQGRAKFGGINAQSVLTQGKILEEGGTGKKMIRPIKYLKSQKSHYSLLADFSS